MREGTWSAFGFGRTILPGMFAWEEVGTARGTAATEVSQRSAGQSWGEVSGRPRNGRQVRARQDRGDSALDQEGTSVMQGFPGTLLTAAPGGWGVGGWPVVAYLPYRCGAWGWDKCSHPSNLRRWRTLKPHKASALLPDSTCASQDPRDDAGNASPRTPSGTTFPGLWVPRALSEASARTWS